MPKSIGPKFPIVITSYEVAMNDAKKFLRHYNWKYLVVDEVLIFNLFCSYWKAYTLVLVSETLIVKLVAGSQIEKF